MSGFRLIENPMDKTLESEMDAMVISGFNYKIR